MQTCFTGRPRRRANTAGRTTLLVVVAASTACYQYLPNKQPDLRVGEEVRVHLTNSGSAALQGFVGSDVAAIDGRVTARSDTAYALSVGGTTKRTGGSAVWSGEPVTVPVGVIAQVDRRVLDKRKTLLVSALSAGVGALAAVVISSVSGGGSSGPDTGTTPP